VCTSLPLKLLLDAIAAAGYQAQGFIDVALLPTLAAYTKIFYVSETEI
jgi:hypothetical protein